MRHMGIRLWDLTSYILMNKTHVVEFLSSTNISSTLRF